MLILDNCINFCSINISFRYSRKWKSIDILMDLSIIEANFLTKQLRESYAKNFSYITS